MVVEIPMTNAVGTIYQLFSTQTAEVAAEIIDNYGKDGGPRVV